MEVEIPASLVPEALGPAGLTMTEENGRVFYPAIQVQTLPPVVKDVLSQAKRPALRILGQILDQPGKIEISFLFRGREPLKLAIQSQRIDRMIVAPFANPAGYQRTLNVWWRQYTAGPSFWEKSPDYPPLVQNYLRAMLARRLNLPLPRPPKAQTWQDQLAEDLGLAAGTEAVRLNYQRERFLAPLAVGEPANLPLPPPVEAAEAEIPDLPAAVKVESLAGRVPAECLYVRYGSFNNFLWFQDTLALWGGDFQNLVAARGLDFGTKDRFEGQLAVRTTEIGRMLGPLVIADVAMIGTDMFLREGGAYGLLFQARNSTLLANDFAQQRAERVKKGGAKEEKIRIDGREVSYLSSPDGRLRSFYVSDGDFHFVTTSKTLVRRFLATRSGKGSLGASKEFRHARSVLPRDRDDTVFIYLSRQFFHNLISPQYRIEMLRRMQATSDIELTQLAMLGAAAEKQQAGGLEAFAAQGFLPPGFGPRSDGSQAVVVLGHACDSLRGERGYFIPVPDLEVKAVNRFELENYERFVRFFEANWKRLDPLMAGIQRRSLGQDREHVTIDLQMSPLARRNYERLMGWVGPPDKQRIAPIPGDSAAFDVILPKQRLFGGVQFIAPSLEALSPSLLVPERLRNLVVGYLGTTGELGLLARLSRYVETVPDPSGYSAGRLGLWRRQSSKFTLFSFQREMLEAVTPQLHFEEAERSAQFRLRAADLSRTRLASFVNAWGYHQTRETSLGNLRLMQQLIAQLHVPGDQAKAVAERLLDARLIDPLRGQYVYRQAPDGPAFWTSTALEATPGRSPSPGYQTAVLDWFRGLNMDALLEPEHFSAHVELDVQMPGSKSETRSTKSETNSNH